MTPRRRDDQVAPTTATQLADALRARILDGEVAPGASLREEELALRHGVSRHTVRTALAALASEGIVEAAPYRGARVAALDDASLIALQQLRGALETEAVRLTTETHGRSWPDEVTMPIDAAVDDLARAEASGDWPAITRAHALVHRTIVAAAGSPRIAEAHRLLESEILLLLAHVRPDYPPGALAHEHRAYLVDIMSSGGSAVRAHLDHSTALIRAARSSPDAD